jgi:DNA-binding transcriptional LysR family regulator
LILGALSALHKGINAIIGMIKTHARMILVGFADRAVGVFLMSRRLPPLYALRAFEAASRHNSFTRAAEELSITQSAVSRHIRTLEEHFACRLFQRSGRTLQLTESARLLLPGVREGFAALERACHTLNAEDDILRMKAPSTLTMRWLLARLSRFRHLQPGNEVQLTSAWMSIDEVDFNQEPFDCAGPTERWALSHRLGGQLPVPPNC